MYSHVSCLQRLILRIRFDAKAAQCSLGAKFGCDPNTEAYDLITLSKSLGLNVRIQFSITLTSR